MLTLETIKPLTNLLGLTDFKVHPENPAWYLCRYGNTVVEMEVTGVSRDSLCPHGCVWIYAYGSFHKHGFGSIYEAILSISELGHYRKPRDSRWSEVAVYFGGEKIRYEFSARLDWRGQL